MDKARRQHDTPLQKYHASFASPQEVLDFIVSNKITTQKLTVDNIEKVSAALMAFFYRPG